MTTGMRDPNNDTLPAVEQANKRLALRSRGLWAGAAAAAVIIAVGVFHLLTIRPGHLWGDDFAQYIHHAKNLVQGVPYQNTGHIYNYRDPGDAPASYPPVFPLLLTPVYALFGLNLAAMKAEVILLWLAGLAMLYFVFRRDLSVPATVGLLAMVGFNPFLWDFKDQIVSDLPFIFFLGLVVYLIQRWHGIGFSPAGRAVHALVLGLAIYLAYGSRSVGAVLILSLPLLDLLQLRRLRLDTIATMAVFGVLFLLNGLVFGGGASSSYLKSFRATPPPLLANLDSIRWALNVFLENGYSVMARRLLVVLLSAVAVTGYLTKVRRRITVLEVFPVLYLAVLLAYPYAFTDMPRYFIPLFPWYVFYVLVGVETLRKRAPAPVSRVALAGLAVIVFASYAGQYTKLDFGPIRDGVAEPEAVQLFAHIREKTNPDDVFLFSRPLALALFGERASSSYYLPERAEDLWTYAREIHATDLVVGTGRRIPISGADYIWTAEDGAFFRQFANDNKDRLMAVFSNADFVLYRITSYPPERRAAPD